MLLFYNKMENAISYNELRKINKENSLIFYITINMTFIND